MMNAPQLLFKPHELAPGEGGVLVETNPSAAGWEYLSFHVRRLAKGERWSGSTDGEEAALVVLGGKIALRIEGEGFRESWGVGERSGPFGGLPWSAYLPPRTGFSITSEDGADVAWATAPAEGRYPPRLIPPGDVRVEARGEGTTSRTIHHMLPPDFPAERLIVVEVFTPEGHWSSYPPHKHDVENLPHENLLEETYYYRIDPPQGFALQRIYTHDGRWDVALVCEDGDLVLVPEGYHPVSAAAGYECYYLNAQAGPSRAWLVNDDPAHTWIKQRAASR
ncbi:MAG TPA: 5-deoxy-glucuronate isomerase [Chloroflexia bacterium]|nr:5-deoxy-glucuronate isomerase [Chloroflexia bacterium]